MTGSPNGVPTGRLHDDFADLGVEPGVARISQRPELFDIVNVIAFGGAADRPTHVPTEIGRVGPVVLWESTGASDALPFWNTNYRTDVYLYIVHGGVRVELKEPEGDEVYGEYVARTGDLFRLPRDVAHRTYSLDGHRRITLEILEHDPAWSTIGRHAEVAPADDTEVGGFRFELGDEHATVTHGADTVRAPLGFFIRGLRALVAWELHLAHNEFDGGFVVHDDAPDGDTVTLKIPGHADVVPSQDVIAVFKRLIERHTARRA
jgi:hypothetical protein